MIREERKKVMHVLQYFNVAGAENVVKNLVLNMDPSLFDSEIAVLNETGINGIEMLKLGYAVHGLNWTSENISGPKLTVKLRSLLDRRKVDLIHAHNFTPWFFSCFAKALSETKLCVTIHGFIHGVEKLSKRIQLLILSFLTDQIILVSDILPNQFRSISKLLVKKTRVISNGINLTPFRSDLRTDYLRTNMGVQKDDFVLATVGRLYRVKNLEMQIRLVRYLKTYIPNIKLVIAARILPYAETLRSLAEQLEVSERIVFLGLRKDVPDLLRASDIFLLTSYTEGASLAILEAMAAGLPVIASDVGGNGRLIDHGKNGLLFDVNDLECLANHVLDLYKHPFNRQLLGTAAKSKARNYSVESMVRGYEMVYERILKA